MSDFYQILLTIVNIVAIIISISIFLCEGVSYEGN